MQENKKKTVGIILAICALIAVIGVTYAFMTETLTGTKKVTISAGTLSLVLDEKNEITISDGLPMYDAVGMIQEKVFTFDLINETSNPTAYTLKLQKVSTSNELQLSDVKYYLTKDGVGQPALLSSLASDGTVDTGTIAGNDTIEYTLRLWIRDGVTDITIIQGKSLSYKLKVEAGQEGASTTTTIPTSVTFAGITKEVSVASENMFNYTSEGIDPNGGESIEATNGIYAMEDDDALSYYYRGNVDNLVKFGSYTKDYYVYRYFDTRFDSTSEFISLEACKFYNSSCSESNKVLKYAASDNVPMYWRIVRVNGDGTIRMIYAGTTPDATGDATGIGLSRYNDGYNYDSKYTGYTYDKSTTEVASAVKTEIDIWYANALEGTTYDSKIATGKFCNDSSGYEYDTFLTNNVFSGDAYSFASFRRIFANMYGTGNSNPTLKCSSEADANFGGSYNLKAGLITSDEIVAAGGQTGENNSYYLYNGTKGNSDGEFFWSMSPVFFGGPLLSVANVNLDGSLHFLYDVFTGSGLVRPVINLRADVRFKSGTDGSKERPYELVD